MLHKNAGSKNVGSQKTWGQVLHSYILTLFFQHPANGRVVNSKGLRNLLCAVTPCGIGLLDGRAALWQAPPLTTVKKYPLEPVLALRTLCITHRDL